MNEDRSTGLWLQDTVVIIEGEQSTYVPVEYGVPQVLIWSQLHHTIISDDTIAYTAIKSTIDAQHL
jgi:hypothetical protein